MELGFIGIGQMGRWHTRNLIKAGFKLVVFDINQAPVKELAELGARAATSPEEVALMCRKVIICLPTTETVEEVVLGDRGILSGAKRGDLLMDTGTTEPLVIKKIAEIANEKGISVLEVPVLGGVTFAREASSTVLVGGEKKLYEENLKIFRAIGKKIFYVGGSGSAMTAKIINNSVGISNIALFSEALVLGVKAGIEAKTLYEIIKAGSGNSWQFEVKTPRILKRDFEPLARMGVAYKDLVLARSLAARLGAPLNVVSAAAKLYEQAAEMHLADEDMLAVIKVAEKTAGVEVRE